MNLQGVTDSWQTDIGTTTFGYDKREIRNKEKMKGRKRQDEKERKI